MRLASVYESGMEQLIFAGPLSPIHDRDVAEHPAVAELGDMDGLYATYRSRIYRYALLSLRDPELAESITHDCLLKAFNARSHFRGDCSVATWLTRIATNLIRDQVRSRKLQFWKAASNTAVDVGEIADRLRSPGLTPEGLLLVKEQVKGLWAAVEKLTAKQRSVFLLRFVEELDLSEIATAMGMNVGTVKSHLHRALASVRSAMEKTR
jgi:RNA polymerase sigma-70 factor (ECF subfamily)